MTDQSSANPRKTLADLLEVMAALRTPVTGCPWDLEQDFRSIAPYTIEEAYEVADAIARNDLPDLEEELGDLLLQVVYHARMAEEQGAFDFHDVANAVTRKMIRRHPHVFGTPEERAAGAQPDFWARIKAEEKAAKEELRRSLAERQAGHTTSGPKTSPNVSAATQARSGLPTRETSLLADVPLPLPALSRAIKLQDKAARVGFDWPSIRPVFDKMREELSELEEVAVSADPRGGGAQEPPSPQEMKRIEEELGDLLFVMANVARHLKLDPEAALRGANEKFQRRFLHIERRLAEIGKTPAESNLAEMDKLWDEARAADKTDGAPVKRSDRSDGI
ncbi:MAG: nucleoside triphosphate pyrophosphohydrolase [Hyphomicrobiaceae bacterium]|nr:nucleoside triphosphate pyrophosphohydrolase [Hyphomicrobiaceae bacterium]